MVKAGPRPSLSSALAWEPLGNQQRTAPRTVAPEDEASRGWGSLEKMSLSAHETGPCPHCVQEGLAS